MLEGYCGVVLTCVQELPVYLIGADSDRIEDLWNTIYRADFYRGGVLMSALVGID